MQFKRATVAHHPLNEPNEGVIGNRYSNGVVPMPLSNGGLGNTGRKYLEKEGPANLKVIRVFIIKRINKIPFSAYLVLDSFKWESISRKGED